MLTPDNRFYGRVQLLISVLPQIGQPRERNLAIKLLGKHLGNVQ